MRKGGRVDHGLVIEEFVALARHVASVEPEELAELLRFEDLDALMPGPEMFDLPGGPETERAFGVQPLENELARCTGGIDRTPIDAVDQSVTG